MSGLSGMSGVSPVVEIRDLFRVYPSAEGGVAALQGLTLTVDRGELCVVLGPSGSGKSTLLRIVAGFDRPSAGSVTVAGTDVGGLGSWAAGRFRSRAIGYADQHYWRALAGELTARELVGVQLGLAGGAPASAARTSCSSASGSARAAMRTRVSSPAASSSASPCARRSRDGPTS